MNPLAVSLRGKGVRNFARRAFSIVRQYGRPGGLDGAWRQFMETLAQFDYPATFPIVGVVLERHPHIWEACRAGGIELAVHGYHHVDHARLLADRQAAHIEAAAQLFRQAGIPLQGFRGPYLHANADTLAALRQHGFSYDGSPSLSWEVVNGHDTPAYRHVLKFYGTRSAEGYPSLPTFEDGLVRIPYSLPDDEALTHRLHIPSPERRAELWMHILRRTYELGELFVLGLHPERIAACRAALVAVLSAARALRPAVWVARLDEIAAWWRARAQTAVEIAPGGAGHFLVTVRGDRRVTVLARAVEVDAPTRPWSDGYQQVLATTFTVRAAARPCIGLAAEADPALQDFLRQQGYIPVSGARQSDAGYYLAQTSLAAEEQRDMLVRLESGRWPCVRLGRWPAAARSALAVTGDIDAWTLGDYGRRFVGR